MNAKNILLSLSALGLMTFGMYGEQIEVLNESGFPAAVSIYYTGAGAKENWWDIKVGQALKYDEGANYGDMHVVFQPYDPEAPVTSVDKKKLVTFPNGKQKLKIGGAVRGPVFGQGQEYKALFTGIEGETGVERPATAKDKETLIAREDRSGTYDARRKFDLYFIPRAKAEIKNLSGFPVAVKIMYLRAGSKEWWWTIQNGQVFRWNEEGSNLGQGADIEGYAKLTVTFAPYNPDNKVDPEIKYWATIAPGSYQKPPADWDTRRGEMKEVSTGWFGKNDNYRAVFTKDFKFDKL